MVAPSEQGRRFAEHGARDINPVESVRDLGLKECLHKFEGEVIAPHIRWPSWVAHVSARDFATSFGLTHEQFGYFHKQLREKNILVPVYTDSRLRNRKVLAYTQNQYRALFSLTWGYANSAISESVEKVAEKVLVALGNSPIAQEIHKASKEVTIHDRFFIPSVEVRNAVNNSDSYYPAENVTDGVDQKSTQSTRDTISSRQPAGKPEARAGEPDFVESVKDPELRDYLRNWKRVVDSIKTWPFPGEWFSRPAYAQKLNLDPLLIESTVKAIKGGKLLLTTEGTGKVASKRFRFDSKEKALALGVICYARRQAVEDNQNVQLSWEKVIGKACLLVGDGHPFLSMVKKKYLNQDTPRPEVVQKVPLPALSENPNIFRVPMFTREERAMLAGWDKKKVEAYINELAGSPHDTIEFVKDDPLFFVTQVAMLIDHYSNKKMHAYNPDITEFMEFQLKLALRLVAKTMENPGIPNILILYTLLIKQLEKEARNKEIPAGSTIK